MCVLYVKLWFPENHETSRLGEPNSINSTHLTIIVHITYIILIVFQKTAKV